MTIHIGTTRDEFLERRERQRQRYGDIFNLGRAEPISPAGALLGETLRRRGGARTFGEAVDSALRIQSAAARPFVPGLALSVEERRRRNIWQAAWETGDRIGDIVSSGRTARRPAVSAQDQVNRLMLDLFPERFYPGTISTEDKLKILSHPFLEIDPGLRQLAQESLGQITPERQALLEELGERGPQPGIRRIPGRPITLLQSPEELRAQEEASARLRQEDINRRNREWYGRRAEMFERFPLTIGEGMISSPLEAIEDLGPLEWLRLPLEIATTPATWVAPLYGASMAAALKTVPKVGPVAAALVQKIAPSRGLLPNVALETAVGTGAVLTAREAVKIAPPGFEIPAMVAGSLVGGGGVLAGTAATPRVVRGAVKVAPDVARLTRQAAISLITPSGGYSPGAMFAGIGIPPPPGRLPFGDSPLVVNARKELFTRLEEQVRLRESDIVDEAKAKARSLQSSQSKEAFQASLQAAEGSETALLKSGKARFIGGKGAQTREVAESLGPVNLSPTSRQGLFDEISRQRINREITTNQADNAAIALTDALDSTRILADFEIGLIRRTQGDEIAEMLGRRQAPAEEFLAHRARVQSRQASWIEPQTPVETRGIAELGGTSPEISPLRSFPAAAREQFRKEQIDLARGRGTFDVNQRNIDDVTRRIEELKAMEERGFNPGGITGTAQAERKALEKSVDTWHARPDIWQKGYRYAIDAFTMPISWVVSFDFSWVLRQGLMLGAGHPKAFARSLAVTLPVFRSEKVARAVMESIEQSRHYDLMVKSKLFIAEFGQEAVDVTKREEFVISRFVSKLPVLRNFERVYVVPLNKLRAQVFEGIVDSWEGTGKTAKQYHDIAQHINYMTGRGSLPSNIAPALSIPFLAPRLFTSRIQGLLQFFDWRVSGAVRLEIARDLGAFIGLGMTIMGLLKLSGASIETDPRSSDFGKGRIGPHRIDLWAGNQPIARYAAQIITGQRKSTDNGTISGVNGGDVAFAFVRSKFSPVPGAIATVRAGSLPTGEPIDVKTKEGALRLLENTFVPFIGQDFKEAYEVSGPLGTLAAIPGIIGAGVTSYRSLGDVRNEVSQELFQMNYRDLPAKHPQDPTRNPRQEVNAHERVVEKVSERPPDPTSLEGQRSEAFAQQEFDDTQVKAGKIGWDEWSNNRSGRILKLVGAGEREFGDEPIENPKDAYDHYLNMLLEVKTPSGTLDWDRIEAWLAKQSAIDQQFIDARIGFSDTDWVRQRRLVAGRLDDVGYFDQRDGAWADVKGLVASDERAVEDFPSVAQAETYADWVIGAENLALELLGTSREDIVRLMDAGDPSAGTLLDQVKDSIPKLSVAKSYAASLSSRRTEMAITREGAQAIGEARAWGFNRGLSELVEEILRLQQAS